MIILDTLLRLIVFAAGLWLFLGTMLSAVRSFVLPRSEDVVLTRTVFLLMYRLFTVTLTRTRTYGTARPFYGVLRPSDAALAARHLGADRDHCLYAHVLGNRGPPHVRSFSVEWLLATDAGVSL